MEATKHARGALVSISGQLGRFVIKLLGLALLSRILTDHEVGQVAMVLAVVGIAGILSDFGLSLAAIQVKTLTNRQANTLFWTNICIGLTFTIAAFLSAPLIASFYGSPELDHLTRLLSPIFILNSAAVQFRVQLNRDLRYTSLAIIDVIAPLIGVALAIICAINDFGATSLVIQEVATAITILLACAITSRWRPDGLFHSRDLATFMTFGISTTATQASNYISTNTPTTLIGAALGSATAGQYSRAYQIFMLPIQQLASPLTRVALPMLSRSSTAEFNQRLKKIQLLLGYVLSTPLTLFAIWAYPIVHVALGPGWNEAAGILEILCIGGCFQAAGYAYYWAFLARSQVKVLFVSELFGRTVLVILVILAVGQGTRAVAAAFSAGLCVVWLTTALVSIKTMSLDVRQTWWIFTRSIGIGLFALTISALFTTHILDGGRGLQASFLATSIYAVVILSTLAIPAVRRDMIVLLSFRHLLKKQEQRL